MRALLRVLYCMQLWLATIAVVSSRCVDAMQAAGEETTPVTPRPDADAVEEASAAAPRRSPPPHILLCLVDDLGRNSMYNNPDIISPTVDALAEAGIKLTALHTYSTGTARPPGPRCSRAGCRTSC